MTRVRPGRILPGGGVHREQAARCRRLAAAVTDRAVTRRLLELAIEYEEKAARAAAEEAR